MFFDRRISYMMIIVYLISNTLFQEWSNVTNMGKFFDYWYSVFSYRMKTWLFKEYNILHLLIKQS